jgi:hypothetical protein
MLELILLPIIRFCVRRSLRLNDLVTIAKQCFIKIALEELKLNKVPATASKISAMTGVHRKDIKQSQHTNEIVRLVEHPVVRLINLWQNDKKYLDLQGNPLELEIGTSESTFIKLVKQIGGDLNPYSILFELDRIGAIERKENDLIALTKNSFIDNRYGWDILGDGITDLVESVEYNLQEDNHSKNLQLKTVFDVIPAEYEDEIRIWIRKKGTQFHNEIAKYIASYDLDNNPELPFKNSDRVEVSVSAFSVIRKNVVK